MSALPESLFQNPVWSALHTAHARFAVREGDACRYPAEVVPFAAVRKPGRTAMEQLRSLLAANESVWVAGEELAEAEGLHLEERLDCFQMWMPPEVQPPEARSKIVGLSAADADEMVALTTLAFPGFFRRRTCEMGSYFGVRSAEGELIAMGGERLRIERYAEVSGVCTHPALRGRGFAQDLIWRVIEQQRREGHASFLHVGCANRNAWELYLRMGFEMTRTVMLNRFQRC